MAAIFLIWAKCAAGITEGNVIFIAAYTDEIEANATLQNIERCAPTLYKPYKEVIALVDRRPRDMSEITGPTSFKMGGPPLYVPSAGADDPLGQGPHRHQQEANHG